MKEGGGEYEKKVSERRREMEKKGRDEEKERWPL